VCVALRKACKIQRQRCVSVCMLCVCLSEGVGVRAKACRVQMLRCMHVGVFMWVGGLTPSLQSSKPMSSV